MIVTGSASGTLAMIEFKGSHFEREIILWGVRWYVAYPISYRQLEEMMEERGVEVDHATLKRLIRAMLGFQSFWSAAVTFAGIELMHMIRKGQLRTRGRLRPAQQFYSLAG
jgi:transposase-like protein